MLEEKYRNLQKKEEVRETLSFLRNEIKDEEKLTVLKSIAGEEREIIALLSNEDAKTRKNAALLIGDLQLFHAAEDLLEAYRNETTLFVKSSYLAALGRLNAEDSLDFFKKRFEELVEKEVSEEEKKHVNEELRELNKIITGIEGIKKHTFIGFKKPHEMLLTTNREQREVTLQEVCELSAAVHKKADLHPLGVLVFSKEVIPFTKLRTYRELLFPISVEGKIQKNAQTAAKQLWSSNLYEFLTECHKGSDAFAFRLEVKGSQQQIDFIKKLSSALEQVSGFKFRNSTKEYEIELRLMETKDGGFVPFLKLFTLQMKRFSYRKNAIAMSIHPAAAAMLVHLAKPYLKEGAQVLDPCCGVGTMLIERDICVPAGDMYATDIFGDAIEMGRENATLAGEKINFVHRDFFDFKHNYPFDEIITNMPVKGKKTKEEMDAFYDSFFEKARTLLKKDGVIIMYTNEVSFVKKQLRLKKEYRLLQEFCVRKKEQFYLFIIGMKG